MKKSLLLVGLSLPIFTFGQDTIKSFPMDMQIHDLPKSTLPSQPEETFDEVAQFPGDINAYLSKNIKYPAPARFHNIQGKVLVVFDIDENGAVQNVKATRGIGYYCDEEAVSVVKNMPKWEPAKKNKKPISMHYLLYVNFRISN